jgi:hypothetical protein
VAFAISHRHNSSLHGLSFYGNPSSHRVCKLVALEVVLCQVRNAQVTQIDASGKHFDDADATRIAEALRCDILRAQHVCVRPQDLYMVTGDNCCEMLRFSPFLLFLTAQFV